MSRFDRQGRAEPIEVEELSPEIKLEERFPNLRHLYMGPACAVFVAEDAGGAYLIDDERPVARPAPGDEAEPTVTALRFRNMRARDLYARRRQEAWLLDERP